MAPKTVETKITSKFKPIKASSTTSTAEKQPKSRNWDQEREVLRCFDLDINYGPIVGITRKDRLARAENFAIPICDAIKQILNDPELPNELNFNIWHDLENII
jgi:hypothetical protein